MAKFGPDKQLCGAQRPNQPVGVLCTRPAGWGTSHSGTGHCKRHGGSTTAQTVAAGREIARRECDRLGIPVEVDPGEALLQELWETAGNVAFYRSLVQDLPTHPDPDEYHPPETQDDPGHWTRGEPGVYGRTYHATGVPTGEGKPHILVALYNDERKHLAAVAAAALKAGVEARRVEIEQQRAELMADVFRRVFDDPELELTAEQRRTGLVKAAGHLRLASG